ncbi:TPA: hypothetical protein KNO10_003169 [Clostridioides difficile]|uniref:hypothetical protein n=1 Tax=Clostridioides difficile TaxID=1496 RepID=UPI0009800266|nr:hypothetical protein [Clostridioides difficile]SJQ81474.1 Uncharacterised protein [Clostridioides difficile]HBF0729996.1 hypothetical protein [Clostridioides difficile]HBF6041075.1 hypothetical protein [Clostridioides difficile]HBF7388921.1 hypothetical protein [Clostridioides difficile]HBG3350767.1 hypothetical protein [Clostridioides difficile]
MKFEYYYLIQDIAGILLAFIGLRMSIIGFRILSMKGLSINTLLIVIKYCLFTIAGLNLLISKFGIKHWIWSVCMLIISIIINPRIKVSK